MDGAHSISSKRPSLSVCRCGGNDEHRRYRVLRIEDAERKGAEFATFEVRRLELMAVERAVTDSGLEQKVVNLDGWPHEAQAQERLRFGGVKLISHNATESYELFDVSLTDLAFDGRIVPGREIQIFPHRQIP